MSMDLHDKDKLRKHLLTDSFGFAISGILTAIRKERNLKIHLFLAVIVILLGFILSITVTEWLFIILAIGGMLVAEMMNSAIERVVDLTTQDYHPLAKQAKDMAAGAVLLFAVASVSIGILIFGPKLFRILL
jgi:undecaprenol kinase